MDLTNVNSMELLRKIGLADLVREKGVPSHFSYPVIFSTGLHSQDPVTKWVLPSVDEYRRKILTTNDGSQPREPYQRISQELFEAALKERCDSNDLIDLRFGWKVTSVTENDTHCRTTVTHRDRNESWVFTSRYVAGCDGASSVIRQSLHIPLSGGAIPSQVLLVHFKSRDLSRLHTQGRFWHLFMLSDQSGISGACICQDEVDTFTVHMFLPPDTDGSDITSEEAVAKVLGGNGGPYDIQIDKILVRSIYVPHVAVSERYMSPKGRVYLAGDSCHQNIPTGGYGMNMGVGDAFDLGWKLSATIKGYGGLNLLRSYEDERRPIALVSVEHSKRHLEVHLGVTNLLAGKMDIIDTDTPEAQSIRQKIHEYYQIRDAENKDIGIEMGQRYQSAVIAVPGETTSPPPFDPSMYTPSTYPGCRAPHVFLKTSEISVFDGLGSVFTLVEFKCSGDSSSGERLTAAASKLSIPLTHLILTDEDHAYHIYQASLVLLRPDFHVAWRGESVGSSEEGERIVRLIAGHGPE